MSFLDYVKIAVVATAIPIGVGPCDSIVQYLKYREGIETNIKNNFYRYSFESEERKRNIFSILTLCGDGVQRKPVAIARKFLISRGAKEENIHILDYNELGPISFQYKFEILINELSEKMGPEDEFIFVHKSHGDYSENEGSYTTIEVNGGYMNDEYLFEQFSKINTGKVTCIVGACGSGGFVDKLQRLKNVTCMSSSDKRASDTGALFGRNFVTAVFESSKEDRTTGNVFNNGKSKTSRRLRYMGFAQIGYGEHRNQDEFFIEPELK